jgi:hypothetical protein
MRNLLSSLLAASLCLPVLGTTAAGAPIYRCEGPPVLFTSDPSLYKTGRCIPVSPDQPVTASGGPQLWRKSGPGSSESPRSVQPRSEPRGARAGQVVPRSVQRERDAQRVPLIQAELAGAEQRLQSMRQRLATVSSNAKQQGGERQDSLRRRIRQVELDVEALKRELASAAP